eukprot:TRINITY_DN20449_c0_g1_i1.p1 TRINITY_DN20449_c0_g1~~TRINITY_DN20449_c0_g1_i1.p1  ORF type:complete len:249 (-),score=87.46 TRINITY_DN20449_c0_g1_i1:320-958(-)
MLRSLVGSEMCIRDRYQRRVRGHDAVMASSGRRLLDFLAGSWRMSRLIHSNQTGTTMASLEDAMAEWVVTEKPYRMLYTEQGQLLAYHGGAEPSRLEVKRQYLYGFDEEHEIDVWFHQPGGLDHDKFFHRFSLPPDQRRARAEHLCVDDLYKGEIVLDGDDRFTTRWHVRGPAKDYTITSKYTRDPKARHDPDNASSQESQPSGQPAPNTRL